MNSPEDPPNEPERALRDDIKRARRAGRLVTYCTVITAVGFGGLIYDQSHNNWELNVNKDPNTFLSAVFLGIGLAGTYEGSKFYKEYKQLIRYRKEQLQRKRELEKEE